MTDLALVKRLRDYAADGKPAICIEAADAIEAMHAALEQIRDLTALEGDLPLFKVHRISDTALRKVQP